MIDCCATPAYGPAVTDSSSTEARARDYVGLAALYAVLGGLFDIGFVILAVGGVLVHGWRRLGRDARLRDMWRSSHSLMRWGLGPAPRRPLVVGVLAGLGLAVVSVALTLLSEAIWSGRIGASGALNPTTSWLLSHDIRLVVASLLLLLVAAPIASEVSLRGMVGSELREARWSPVYIWLTTTLLFVLVPADFSVLGMMTRFLTGSVFWILWHQTSSVWPGVMAHGAYNGALATLALLA